MLLVCYVHYTIAQAPMKTFLLLAYNVCYNIRMKVPVDARRTIITFLVVDLIFAVLLFLSCINLFLFTEWGIYQILVIAIFVIVSVSMLILSLKRNFYVIESKYLVVVKAFKEAYYYYNDVVYIDEEQSERRRVLCFFTNKGHTRYLPYDKDGEIYKAMTKRCRNTISKDEFETKYPNVKL